MSGRWSVVGGQRAEEGGRLGRGRFGGGRRRDLDGRVRDYSIDRRRAGARDLLRWWLGRWAIENTGFQVRDMAFDEDRNRTRKGRSANTFSRVVNAATNAIRALGLSEFTAPLREDAFRVDRLFARLGIPIK